MKSKILTIIVLMLGLLPIFSLTAYAQSIHAMDGRSVTISSDQNCTQFYVFEGSTLTVNQGVTLTLNISNGNSFNLFDNSTLQLHGTLAGSVASGAQWFDNTYINVYLSDGAKYTVTGLECMDGNNYLRYYGYDAATDGHGSVSVMNGTTDVTANSTGYSWTTYTFTATPASGYRFVNWTKGAGGEELGTAASIAVSCEQNGQYQVYANFAQTPVPITVRMAEGTEEAANWTLASGNASVPGTQVLEGVLSGSTLVATYSGTRKVKSVKAVRKYGMLEVPLTIEALTAGIVMVQQPKSGMQYTLNGGPKTAMTEAPTEITVAVGDKVAFYGNGTSITSYDGTGITGGTAEVKAYGNIMSLVNETGFATATTLTANNAFYALFEGYANLKDISGLKLPATTLTEGCYASMFSYCTGLTTVPSDLLPATTLARSCYRRMFGGCENLTNVPTLPATTLAMGCYDMMFSFCTGLATVPSDLLPATTLAEGCYSSMFLYCLNLTTAPVLPATTLAEGCYSSMFLNCLNLTTAPVLPATTLVGNCYQEMFYSCSKLSSVTCLATSGINQNSSTEDWLYDAGSDVLGTKTFNAVSTAEWPMNNGNGIPSGWTRQNIDN